MSTDDRADEQRYMTNDELDQFIAAISDPLYKSGFKDGYNRGLLSTPADQDAYQRGFEAAWTDAQRDIDAIKNRADSVAVCDDKDVHWRYADVVAERDLLRAHVAAVRALADEWQRELDSGAIVDEKARYCWSTAVRELRAAGGEQYGE